MVMFSEGPSPVTPAIVAVGFNRPGALLRLLDSLGRASYPRTGIPLVISLDGGGDPRCLSEAQNFAWPHGEKYVRTQAVNRGLREHILICGDLVNEFGAVILFEDDITAAPYFYQYCLDCLHAYAQDVRIGGISLYAYRLNEFNNYSFAPIDDGFDNYFLQIAASWGQMWTQKQWSLFRLWYTDNASRPFNDSKHLPTQLSAWKQTSWKKYYIRYLVENDRYFVFPRFSLSTNHADPGTHTKRQVGIYQVSLDLGKRRWQLSQFDDALAIYDAFYELHPRSLTKLNSALAGVDFVVDCAGTKDLNSAKEPFAISLKPCRDPLITFGLNFVPPEANIALNAPGNFFALGPRASFSRNSGDKQRALLRHLNRYNYFNAYLFSQLKPIQTLLLNWLGYGR